MDFFHFLGIEAKIGINAKILSNRKLQFLESKKKSLSNHFASKKKTSTFGFWNQTKKIAMRQIKLQFLDQTKNLSNRKVSNETSIF